MSPEDPIKVRGVVLEVLPKLRFRVELPNGHRLMGFVPVRHRDQGAGLVVGQPVELEMSPYDFSKGRICFNEE